MIFVFIQNPNVFQEADAEVYLNKNEFYQFASSMELYGGFITMGAICELIRRSVSQKLHLLHDNLFLSYILIMSGQLMEVIGYIIMILN
jgi:hypothetical protein